MTARAADEAGAHVPGALSTSGSRPDSTPVKVSQTLNVRTIDVNETVKARDRERRGRRAGLDDAVAAERQRLVAEVVARLLAQLRGDGQQSLDLYGADPTTPEHDPCTTRPPHGGPQVNDDDDARAIRDAEDDFIAAVARQLSASLVHLLEENPYLRRQYLDGDCRLTLDAWGVGVEVATDDEPERPAWFTGGPPDGS